MVLATDDIGMGILLDPELAYSVPFDSWPHGGAEDPVGFSQCYSEYTKAVSFFFPSFLMTKNQEHIKARY